MKTFKLIGTSLLAGLFFGLAVTTMLPAPASAVICNWNCWSWTCETTPCSGGTGKFTKCYAQGGDFECIGAFNCNCYFDHCADNCAEIPPPVR